MYTFLFWLGIVLSLSAADRYAAESVLNEGKWVKIEVAETGVYKLSHADLRKMGFDNPEKVSVYGYGGWPIPEDFTKEFIDDLPAVAVWKGSDYLLFYGRGVTRWAYASGEFTHTRNPYATKAYYFLTDRDESPKVMASEASVGNGSGLRVTSFDDYVLHERELISLNNSGRDLYGESLTGSSSLLTLNNFPSIPGITDEKAYVTMRFVARAVGSQGRASLQINGENVLNVSIETTGKSDSYTVAKSGQTRAEWTGEKTEKPDVKVSYSHTSHENVHLDFVRLQMKRELKSYGAYTLFRSIDAVGNDARFVIQGANEQTLVWDVTDPQNAKVIETTLNGSELTFAIEKSDEIREFALVQAGSTGFDVPVKTGDVVNQNLHGLGKTDMVIIALPFLQAQAERLAEVHRERDGLTVEVIDPHAIYNEFSSGTPDASAYRRLMKMLYDKGLAAEETPRFLLLFGDGLYDNRGLCSKIKTSFPESTIHQRLLLTYQSENSLNINTYVTDDYFGFLQDYPNFSAATMPRLSMDIAVGRLPLRTETEARQAVDKIIGYMDNTQFGSWKNALAFVADDGSSADSFTIAHMSQADTLTRMIEKNQPDFLIHKVYFDAYKKDRSGQAAYPDVRNRIQKLLKNGLLLINYTGHGDTQSWSDEKVLTQTDIATASYTHLPLWVTATCDFTRFDALATSAGEQVFLNANSGGIALMTTTRVVYSGPNARLNQALMSHLFDKTDGRRLTLGEVLQRTKASLYNDSNKLNFILIGDPALRLAYPDYEIEVTAVNGQPATEMATLQALDRVTVEGQIKDYTGNRMTGFNGMVYPTVLDSQDSITTLLNNEECKDGPFTYVDYPSTLFVGNDKVEDGRFSFSFTVPKDISYSNAIGKMSLYAYDETQGIEAQGAFKNYRVGGSASNPDPDNDGPEIRALYLNDSTFVSGDAVNSTPLFVAYVWDQSGVNITGSSIGHDVILIIDGNPALSYNLNNYFETIPDNEGLGRVIFPLPTLTEGLHTAEFIIWDVHNNSSRATFEFVVSAKLKPRLIEVYATPNPARNQADFCLVHDLPESLMHVEIRVFDMTGRLLWVGEQQGSSELFKDFVLSWDLTDSSGMRLRPGVYAYRAGIKTKYSKEATKGNKLIILGQ
ncbi:type IX secretion system sortase PorU [Parabacteroides sp. PF5-6]|uniref:type IX secretion system sortase PorU n=1 Tax=Parabacteroides sp. PF5-6 TaxID=1742403 RepID=UPI0024055DD1|nr:type IX secretion system sortase PorU [Parabacteroides sp. PF5-6]MDF9829953.1 hypothetical protein [Parabacteroides sp. PF5-6]